MMDLLITILALIGFAVLMVVAVVVVIMNI
jgi:hypothetical protein